MNKFYTYAFLRIDGTPYYIGKGSGSRCYLRSGRTIPAPTDKNRVIKLKENLTEEEAFRHEVYMIAVLPNLRNMKGGGQGGSGWKPHKEWLENNSERGKTLIGEKNPNWGNRWSEEQKKIASEKHTGKIIHTEESKKKISDNNHRTKTYQITSPDGEVIIQKGLTNFCKERGLDTGCMCRVAQGRSKHHKGWTVCYK